jgi:uncharacterized membrane protein YfcA
MIAFDPVFFAVAIPAVIFAGVSKGGFGSGAAFAATPILALIVDPAVALGIMLPLLMLIDVTNLRPYWGQWHTPSALVLCCGAVPGVAIGVWLYRVTDADVFRLLIGGLCLVFVAYQVARSRGILRIAPQPFRPVTGMIAGLVAGFTSFVSHAGGPPVAMFMLSQTMGKTTYQATSVVTFWVINMLKVIPYAIIGVFTVQTLLADLFLAPFAVLGAVIGVKAHHAIPERLFFGVTYTLLIATGSKLIWDALA